MLLEARPDGVDIVADAEGVAVVGRIGTEEPAGHRTCHAELVDSEPQGTVATRGPAEANCHRQGGDQDEESQCSGHGSNPPLTYIPPTVAGRTPCDKMLPWH